MAPRLLSAALTCLLALASMCTPAQTLAEYEHTRWGIKDGLGGSVFWASEAANGMLLLNTAVGYRVFDGVDFHAFEPGKPPPFADAAQALGRRSPTGAVYFVDPVKRVLTRRWKGRTEIVEDKDDVLRWAHRFDFDPDGIGWYGIDKNLYRLDGLKVEAVGAAWGIPNATLDRVAIDARGTVWVGSAEQVEGALYFLPRGARKFERFAQPVACLPAAVAPDGSLWCASSWGLAVVTVVDGRPVSSRFVSRSPMSFIAFDSRGGLWAARASGLSHVSDWRTLLTPEGEAAFDADTMTVKDGLSSNGIWWIEEDTAGSVWVGTSDGLDRFRSTPFKPVTLPRRAWGPAMLADADGSLWVGNYDRNLMRLSGGRIEDVRGVTKVTAISRDSGGRIWVSGQRNLWRKEPGGAFVQIELPSGYLEFTGIAEDDSGTMWFETHGGELLQWRDGEWIKRGAASVPAFKSYFMFSDAQRQLWFSSGPQGMRVLRSGVFRTIPYERYAAGIGNVICGYASGSRVWVSGALGIGAFMGDTFHPLKLANDEGKLISGFVETAEGDLWLHGLTKAFHITKAQVDTGLAGQTVTPEVFDFHDGLVAATGPRENRPTLVQDAAGQLWFSTPHGLFRFDTHTPRRADTPPPDTSFLPVRIDGKLFPPGPTVVSPPGPEQTEFSFAAPALGVSDRIHFRYRLGGVDRVWQDAGTRRTADYTQLPPGRHRFEVIASNEQGRWADAPAWLDLDVEAAWYQTYWFLAAVGAVCLGLLWSLHILRLRVVAARERGRVQVIADERERIARDLHDTLLQGMQGLILGLQSLAIALPPHAEARRAIDGQLDQAEHLMVEARDRVSNLRGTDNTGGGLRQEFELAAFDLAGEARVQIVEEGSPRMLRPFARDSVYLIGREALLNAVTHGKGTRIELRLQYTPRHLSLRVRDNGVGIDPAVLSTGARPSHFGLLGMRERAAQLIAVFKVARVPGGGTDVVLQVPASHAYDDYKPPGLWRKLRATGRSLRLRAFGIDGSGDVAGGP